MGFLLFSIYRLLMGLRLAALRATGAPLLDPYKNSTESLSKRASQQEGVVFNSEMPKKLTLA